MSQLNVLQGQGALAQDATPPGCEAYEEEENILILTLGMDSLHSDGNVDGSVLIDSVALSVCPPLFSAGLTTRLTLAATLFPRGKRSNDQKANN